MSDSIIEILNQRFEAAVVGFVRDAAALEVLAREGLVGVAADARFGDYQCNVAMPLAKTLRGKPREIAERIVAAVQLSDIAEPLEIAGPGFINVRIRSDFLAQRLQDALNP